MDTLSTLILFPIILIVLMFLSFLYSFSETAIASTNKIRIQAILNTATSKRKIKECERVLYFVNNYNQIITAIVIMNNTFNILATVVAGAWFALLLSSPSGDYLASLSTFIVMTILTIVFGELLPKILAKRNPEKGSLWISTLLFWTMKAFSPFTKLLQKFMKGKGNPTITLSNDAEIFEAIKESSKSGVITKQEAYIMSSTLKLNDVTANKIMVPIKDVGFIRVNTTRSKLLKEIKRTTHTRYPILDEKGYPVAVFNSKLFLLDEISNLDVANKTSKKEKIIFDFDKYVYDLPLFEGKVKIAKILRELREERLAISGVINHAGKLIGVISVEDILEEVVGEFYDETDREKDGILDINENKYIIHPSAEAHEVLSQIYKVYKDAILNKNKSILFEDWVKLKFKKKELEENDYFDYKNTIIWVRNSKVTSVHGLSFEIDILK